ncbi:MAG: sigma-70 family RNA polymerase sigma factor [Oscillospiraceae bacterium]|nr:sigma-70 family RNA polymerase sigma factor [Oscillospiraceae bacterium]
MEDSRIVALYWERSERAITETDAKYGGFCRSVARNLLGSREDAEEVVNDTYHEAWNSMPEARPTKLGAWLGRVVRNLSIDRWRRDHRQKRFAGIETLLSELDDCVPARETTEQAADAAELGRTIDAWLRTLPEADAALFLRRYWNGDALVELARECGETANKLAQRMYRLRLRLKRALEEEGYTV